MSDAIPIPPHPTLEHYETQAHDLLEACRASDPAAIRAWTNQWSKLWPDTGPIERRLRETEIGQLADAQFFLAQAHNFESWPKFAKHIQSLQRAGSPDATFEAAADAIAAGDTATLHRLLEENPELILRRSSRNERSTLLHYVSANGIEDFRQKTPANIVEIATLLLDAGATVNAESDAYAGRSTTLGLVATSAHPREAGLQIPLMELLLARGAVIDGFGGNAVRACLANGCPEAAEFLVSRGAELDLEGAAGIGRLDVVQRLAPSGTKEEKEIALRLACGYGRHAVVAYLLESSVDPSVSDTADGMTPLHWAAHAADVESVKLLLARNAPLEVRNVYGGTVLGQAVWAALNNPQPGHVKVIETLIDAGAKAGEDWFTGRPDIDAALQRPRPDAPPLSAGVARAVELMRQANRARHEERSEDAMRIAAEAIELLRRSDEPLRLAHAIRHLADMSPPALAEPLYDEAIAIYRSHERTPALDLANAIRGLAVLKDDERLWQEAHDLYMKANVPPGVAEAAAQLARLARRRQ